MTLGGPGTRTSAPPQVEFSVLAERTERLDRFLADQLQLSRTRAPRLVADRAVSVNAVPARASRTLVRGDRVAVVFPAGEPPRQLRPAQIPLTVVWEDEHLAVIDKPACLVVHPAPGHWDDTLVNALVARGTTLAGGAEGRPGIVHRLDRDTSGLMIVAKTDLAHRRLGHMLAARRVTRETLSRAPAQATRCRRQELDPVHRHRGSPPRGRSPGASNGVSRSSRRHRPRLLGPRRHRTCW